MTSPETPAQGRSSGKSTQPEANSQDSLNANAPAGYDPAPMQCEATRLMTAVREGDRQAFDDLITSVRGRAFHVARALVGSRDDALELCQESFLKVFRSRDAYNPGQPFLPWFHRILRNTCFSFLRKHRRLKQYSIHSTTSDGEELDWEIVDPLPGPSSGVEVEERARLFQAALGELSARDREILSLRHFKDMAYREIAEALAIPEGTVMSRLFHARRRLRDALGPMLSEITGYEEPSVNQSKGAR